MLMDYSVYFKNNVYSYISFHIHICLIAQYHDCTQPKTALTKTSLARNQDRSHTVLRATRTTRNHKKHDYAQPH